MKRKILSILLALVLVLSFSLVTAVPVAAAAVTVPDRETAITRTADRLVALQGTDGGWDGDVTGLTAHSGSYPSPANLFGVTALGLIDAYQLTEDETYKTEALQTADHLLTVDREANQNDRIFSFDYRFLVEFSALSGDPIYEAHAIYQWNYCKAVSPLYQDTNQEDYYQWCINVAGVSPGYAAWSIGDVGLAALAMDDTSWASNMADVLVVHLLDITGIDDWRFIGWGKALELLNAVDSAAYSAEITNLITSLTGSQTNGYWPGTLEQGRVQNTAYAVMGLAAAGGTDAIMAAEAGADWLVAEQISSGASTGGWLDPDDANKEYSYVDSEVLQALAATAAPVTIGTKEYYSIQSAIDSAGSGDTINVAVGDYAGAVVNKGVKIIGVADGASIITSGVPYKLNSPLLTGFRLDADADGAEIRNFTMNGNYNTAGKFWFAVFARNADSVIVDSLALDDMVQGITNWGGSGWEITNNVIGDTYPTYGGGIAIHLGADPTNFPHCDNNLVQYNIITTSAVQNGSFTGAAISLWFDEKASYLEPTTQSMTGNQIKNNSITGTGLENQVGIEIGVGGLDGDNNPDKVAACLGVIHDNTVQDNTIDNAEWGLYLYVTTNLTVQGNTIRNCSDSGIYMKDNHANCLINNNNIYGNTNYELNNTDGATYSTTVDATNNWWGDASGPYHATTNLSGAGNEVSDYVDFDFWLLKLYPTAPTLVTAAASSLSTTSATLNGSLDDLGSALSVEVSFEWGTTTAYGTPVLVVTPLSEAGVFSATISGLSPSTTYHFRVKAVGHGPDIYGDDMTFATKAKPAPAPPTYYTDTNLFGTETRFRISSTGRIRERIEATSADGNLTITIPKDTIALGKDGKRLKSLQAIVDDSPPDPPEDAHIIGLAYDFGPDGATFDPPITLEYTYDPDALPEGVAEEDLILAYYDEATGEWIELDCVVDTENNTITALVSHFTTFAIIGTVPPVPPPPPPAPARFTISSLGVLPSELAPGEEVNISVLVANTGGKSGSYTVVLKIDGVKESEERVTIAAGSSRTVSFSVTKEEADSYTVAVNGLSGSFTVVVVPPEPAAFSVAYLSFSPLEVEPSEAVTVTVLVANIGGESGSYAVVLKIDGVKEAEETVTLAAGESQEVSFSATREEPGDYTVTVDGWSGSFTVLLLVEPPGVNWPAIGGGIAGGVLVVAGLLIFFILRRRAAA